MTEEKMVAEGGEKAGRPVEGLEQKKKNIKYQKPRLGFLIMKSKMPEVTLFQFYVL